MAKYKMNQEAIKEIQTIALLFKALQYADDGFLNVILNYEWMTSLCEAYGYDPKGLAEDARNFEQAIERAETIKTLRAMIDHHARESVAHFRCDTDETCCDRADHTPLNVEVIK